MAGPAMTYSLVDYADVQGLVRFGYGRMTSASYALVRVKDVASAKAWLRAAAVTNAVEQKPPPTTALQIAFTAPGLTKLGLPNAVMKGFSREFHHGMSSKSYRRRFLGDVKHNDPERWDWGGPGREPHLLVMFFAEPEYFDSFVQSTKGNTWNDAFEDVISLGTSNLDGDEPFGLPMASASLRSTGRNSDKRHANNWNTPMLLRSVSFCSGIATNTEKLPIGPYWTRTRRTPNYCPL